MYDCKTPKGFPWENYMRGSPKHRMVIRNCHFNSSIRVSKGEASRKTQVKESSEKRGRQGTNQDREIKQTPEKCRPCERLSKKFLVVATATDNACLPDLKYRYLGNARNLSLIRRTYVEGSQGVLQ